MAKQVKLMVVHRDPSISWKNVEKNWSEATNIESATWIRTYFNRKEGVRYCLWLAPGMEKMKEIFRGLGVGWESMLEVEETVPDLWGGKWKGHVAAESKADTLAF